MPKVLLIEDNEMNRDMLSRRLIRNGYEVLVAIDGNEGVAMARAKKPELILMDLTLPGITGWEATRLLREDGNTASIPIIALTAHAMVSDREGALQSGCDDYDTKPIELTRLLSKMETLLTR
jgi:two-component system, cell cycle response regulator DivK